jgi:hypothetical protein
MSDSYDDYENGASQLLENTYCPNHKGIWPHECGCDFKKPFKGFNRNVLEKAMTTIDEKAEKDLEFLIKQLREDPRDNGVLADLYVGIWKRGYAQAIEDLKARCPSAAEYDHFHMVYDQENGNCAGGIEVSQWLREQLFKENE